MVKKWNLLPFGTRVKMKDDENIKGIIKEYLTDKNKVIEGYSILLDDGNLLACSLDEVIPDIEK